MMAIRSKWSTIHGPQPKHGGTTEATGQQQSEEREGEGISTFKASPDLPPVLCLLVQNRTGKSPLATLESSQKSKRKLIKKI